MPKPIFVVGLPMDYVRRMGDAGEVPDQFAAIGREYHLIFHTVPEDIPTFRFFNVADATDATLAELRVLMLEKINECLTPAP